MQIDKEDSLYITKKWLFQQLNIPLQPPTYSNLDLHTVLVAARVLCLREAELKQLSSLQDLQAPVNPRNEAAALALLLSHESVVCGTSTDRKTGLQQLLSGYPDGPVLADPPPPTASGSTDQQQQQLQPSVQQFPEDSEEQQLFRWIMSKGGASSLVSPAQFSSSSSTTSDTTTTSATTTSSNSSSNSSEAPPLRGCAALSDIPGGATALSLPADLLITYDTAASSDFGKVLVRLGLDPESLAVIWTMVERWEPEAAARPFWQALPEHFGTGLSVPDALVDLLKGLPAHAEFVKARQHVRQQWQQLQQIFSVLLQAYPSYLQPSWFTEAAYLWAVELWYAYAIQVKFPDGVIRPALAPFVSLLNHSPWPHIVHYSTVNPETNTLNLTTFRPVREQQQVFLSYGPLPNQQLLLFYGFAVQGNPFEEVELAVPLQLQQQQQQQGQKQKQQRQGQQQEGAQGDPAVLQLLQQLGLSHRAFTLTVQQPLPAGLLPCLRVVCATQGELQQLQQRLQQLPPAVSSSTACSTTSSGSGRKGGGKRASAAAAFGGSSSSSSSSTGGSEPLAALWAAAERWEKVVGQSSVTDRNDSAALQLLGQLLQQTRAPYEACLAKIERRQQLLAILQQKQGGAGSSKDDVERAFVHGLQVYAKGVLEVFKACATAASV